MANTITGGTADGIITGEDRNRVITMMRFVGASGENYRITTNQQAAENGDGALVEGGEVWTNYDPQGETHYLGNPSGNADVDVHIMYGGRFVDAGGVG